MLLKILILLGVAIAAWFLTRPRKVAAKEDTDMVRCKRCGIYHSTNDTCQCDK
ncbi:MAG: hypothetical protein ACNYPH_00755 [Gammaproteobacteria bacterium WSBS_2016_MAG_OTU1]